MKRCPECRRDYYDDTLLYCLDDGSALLEGPASADEPVTAILSEPGAVATGFLPRESSTQVLGLEAQPQENSGGQAERQSHSAHLAAEPQGSVARRQEAPA